MSDRQKLADAKKWAEGQRKDAPNWYGLTLLDALTETEDKCDRLREALWVALPIVSGRVRELRARNDARSLQMTNDLAEIRAALQEAEDG